MYVHASSIINEIPRTGKTYFPPLTRRRQRAEDLLHDALLSLLHVCDESPLPPLHVLGQPGGKLLSLRPHEFLNLRGDAGGRGRHIRQCGVFVTRSKSVGWWEMREGTSRFPFELELSFETSDVVGLSPTRTSARPAAILGQPA